MRWSTYVDVVQWVRVHIVVMLIVVIAVVAVMIIVIVHVDVGIGLHDVDDIVLDTSDDLRSWGSSGQGDERGRCGGVLDESLEGG